MSPSSAPQQISMETNSTIKLFLSDFSQDLTEIRNSRGENILHFASKLKRSTQIVFFINMGCKLCQQDVQGRTPLHIIIEGKHSESLQIFRNLFKQKYLLQCKNKVRNKRLTDDLKKLFQIYDHQGHTVLHKAVLNNMTDLVEDMLKFCIRNNVNVAAMEVLGCGDSILHLAVKGNLLKIAKLIYGYMPKFLNVRNYAGKVATENEGMTMEMKMQLQMNLKCTTQYLM